MNSIVISGKAISEVSGRTFWMDVDDDYEGNGAHFVASVTVPQGTQGTEGTEVAKGDTVVVHGTLADATVTKNSADEDVAVQQIIARQVAPTADGVRINEVSLVGRLGRDPFRGTKEDGSPAGNCKLNLATDVAENVTYWSKVSVFNGQVAPVMANLAKGSQVAVTGALKAAWLYTKTNGDAGSDAEIRGFRIEFCGPPRGAASVTPAAPVVDEEDIPF